MRNRRERLWRNGLVILGLVGLGISGGTLAALISGSGGFGFDSEAAVGQRRVVHGHHSERGASGSPVFPEFHWGLPEEDPTEWLNRGRDCAERSLAHDVRGRCQPTGLNVEDAVPNGRFVAAGPSGPPPPIETPTDPNDPPLNQPVSGPGKCSGAVRRCG